MKRLSLFALLLCSSLLSYAQPTAKDVVDKFVHKLNVTTIDTHFTLSLVDGNNQNMTYKGHIAMHGNKFVIDFVNMQLAYDGTTLYTYDSDVNELTLSTPLERELAEGNPLYYIRSVRATSTIRFAATGNNDVMYAIEFIPNDQSSNVKLFRLYLRKSDLMPISAIMKEIGNKTTTLTFNSQLYTDEIPDFTLNPDGAEINDIR